MAKAYSSDGLINYATRNFSNFVKELYEDDPHSFPYLDCTNAFFKKLYDDYGIKFNPNIIDPSLDEYIDYEIYTNTFPEIKPENYESKK